jgi:hypothetical protein
MTIIEEPERHLIQRLAEDQPEGPYVCSCGLVCWDAEEGMAHLAACDRAEKARPRKAGAS